ncbi:mechanosensitive ion channel domain-containing protein [Luteimonas soli]|uniref:Small-conductance mechanosensitive channel n=2 Tax=Luteimonas soli TaxID=1648966 RepID=A0ABV7XJ04_9GAMM
MTRPKLPIVLLACLALAAPFVVQAQSAAVEAPQDAERPNDTTAGRQLQAKLGSNDALQDVTANIDDGVAELDGTVLAQAQKDRAGELATETPGVSTVVNKVEIDNSLGAHLRTTYHEVTERLVAMLGRAPLLLVALLVVLLASWLGKALSLNLRLLRLRTDNPYMDGLLRRSIRIIVTLVGVLLALRLLDLSTMAKAVLGSAGVVGLALGFAFKDIAENYIAGVLLSLRKPFSPGDHLRIDDHEGKVVALTSRATILMTLDGNQLQLPNALVFKSVLLNYTQNPKRRFDFKASIDAAHSIRQAQTLALEAYSGIDGVLDDPAPSWNLVENAPSGIELQFFGWVDQRSTDLGKVRGEAIRLVKAAFAHAGIQPPRTVYHVVTSREPGASGPPATPVEPVHGANVDTSVNRDIDDQLAEAQRAGAAAAGNMLEHDKDSP